MMYFYLWLLIVMNVHEVLEVKCFFLCVSWFATCSRKCLGLYIVVTECG